MTMPDDARATAREQDSLAFALTVASEDSAAVTRLIAENVSLRSLNAELLAVVKRTLSLFEAMAVDLDECARILDLVGRAEGK